MTTPTYGEIQKFVQRRHGFVPTTGWITHVKDERRRRPLDPPGAPSPGPVERLHRRELPFRPRLSRRVRPAVDRSASSSTSISTAAGSTSRSAWPPTGGRSRSSASRPTTTTRPGVASKSPGRPGTSGSPWTSRRCLPRSVVQSGRTATPARRDQGPIARPEDGEYSRRDPRDQKLSDRRVGAVRDALIQAGVRRGSLGENSSASHTRRSFVRLAARERTSTASYS